jgi:hypothetical protein
MEHIVKSKNYNVFLDEDDSIILKSYQVFVAKMVPHYGVFIDKKYIDRSRSTSAHISKFLNSNISDIRKKIKDGIIKLTSLN